MIASSVLPQLQRLLELERIHAPSESPEGALLHRLLATLDAAPVLLSYLDSQYRYRFCNRAYETWFGKPREHYVGRTIREVLGEKAFAAIRAEVDAALSGQLVRFERVVPYQHGGIRTVEASYLPHILSDGQVVGYVGLVVDITELKSGAEAKRLAGVLEENEARLRMALEAGSLGTWELDLATERHRWDERTREIFEVPKGAPVTHEDFLASVCPDDLERVRASVALARDGGTTALDLDVCVRGWQTGRMRWLSVRGRVHADAAGRPARLLGTVLDITERKRAETRERRLHAAVTALARATWPEEVGRVLLREAAGALGAASASLSLLSDDGCFLELLAAHGFSEESVAGWRRFPVDTPVMFRDVVRERRPVLHMNFASLLLDYPTLVGAGESLVGRSFAAVPLLLDDGVVGAMGLSFAREDAFDADDVFFLQSLAGQGALAVERARLLAAERKARDRAEALQSALEAERRQLASVLEHLPVGVILAEAPSGRLIAANPQLDVVLRRPFSKAEDISGYTEAYPGRHPDGRRVAPEEWPLARSIQCGETVRGETVEMARGDGTSGIFELCSAPILDAESRVVAGVVLVSDVTEQRRNAETLERSVALREQFVSIVSHDLRSPLQAILTSAALLQQQPEQGPERVRRNATRITASAERMARLIRDLLDLARARSGTLMPLQPRPGRLEDVVRAAVAELEVAYPRRVISLDVEEDTHGDWDADRLEQVVGNLVSNALTHGDPEHPVRVRLSADEARVELSVGNHGRPIPAEKLPRLFEPFARGDATGTPSGLGLGLFIVREIVAAHGGRVSACSSEAEGTVFTAVLPRRRP